MNTFLRGIRQIAGTWAIIVIVLFFCGASFSHDWWPALIAATVFDLAFSDVFEVKKIKRR